MPRDSAAVNNEARDRIGKYELLDHIATGGMGAVYRARNVETGLEVALKVLTDEMAAKPAMIERFRREARSAQKFNHENIVRVYEFDEVDGKLFIAMEFVEGIDLHEHIEQKGKLDPEESRQIMIQAARALAHAASVGIVHRDIKPSNFMLAKKNGRLLVKLTDMGLAREQHNEQFRVTRAGTTVGTVDYISPEQARDSGVADQRSDLYSLGCTWFHMLAGQPPFAKGGLAERLIKHMESPPPDIRKLNPQVSNALVAVLNKLLAKHPDDRYQTAQELVQTLLELNPTRKPASQSQRDTVLDVDDETPRKKGKTGKGKKPRSTTPDEKKPGRKKKSALPWILVVLGVLLLGGGAGAYLVLSRKPAPPVVANPNPDPNPNNGGTPLPNPNPTPPPNPNPIQTPNPHPEPMPPRFAALDRAATPVAVAALTREFRTPWQGNAVPPDAVVPVRVSRSPDGRPGWYPTLEAALAGAPGTQTVTVEIDDNGPLFETPVRLEGRSLVLRAGKGYRPLIVWDPLLVSKDRPAAARAGGPQAFIAVEKGSLWVENLEFAVVWPEAQPARGDVFFAVRGGDVNLRDSTFSVAGRHEGLALARLTGAGDAPVRATFERVQGRGDSLAVLNLDAKRGTIGIESCLFVGGTDPLFRIASGDNRTVDLWAARSTLIGRKTLVAVTAPTATPLPLTSPGFRAHWWDCLLTRMGSEAGGELLRLPEDTKMKNLAWTATNCLYAGWPLLLTGGPKTIAGTSTDEWRLLWGRTEGELTQGNAWPTPVVSETETRPASTYRPQDSAVCFASSTDPDRPLGCPLDKLPASRDGWHALTTERYPVPTVPALDGSTPPIPTGTPEDGLYRGEVIDFQKVPDLGAYLATKKLGPRVVLHLSGTGEKPTSPIRVPAGTSLVLYADPPAVTPLTPTAPLALRFTLRPGTDAPALIATEGGSLEVSNLEIKQTEGAFARSTPYFLQTKGGNLKLYRCKMQSPAAGLAGLKGLVSLEGSGQVEVEKANQLTLTECILLTGQNGVRIGGTGALVSVQGSLIVASGPAVEFAPGATVGPRVGLAASLESSTFATRGAALAIGTTTTNGPVQEPLVIQTRGCLFLDPFGGTATPCLLNARGSTLAAGLILWQSDEDAVDARIPREVVAGEDRQGGYTLRIAQAWGSAALRKLVVLSQLKGTLDTKSWTNLSPLVLPPRPPGLGDRKPGADLVALGVVKKK